jgi:hypothetical protein
VEIELAAVHEAGHSVAQWLVGWELRGLQMTVSESNASDVHSACPYPDLDTASAVRKRLLVLFAGNAATRKRWPNSENDRDDWSEVGKALYFHFRRTITQNPSDGLAFADPEANELAQESKRKSAGFVEHRQVRTAMDEIAEVFRNTTPDTDGKVWLPGATAISVCEKHLGKDFQVENPWSGWLAGE